MKGIKYIELDDEGNIVKIVGKCKAKELKLKVRL